MWIPYERLHNHNKAKHNTTVCIFLGIYCNKFNCPQLIPLGLVQHVQHFTSFTNLMSRKDSTLLDDIFQYAFENVKKVWYFVLNITDEQ